MDASPRKYIHAYERNVSLIFLAVLFFFSLYTNVLAQTEDVQSDSTIHTASETSVPPQNWFQVEGIPAGRVGDFVVGPGKVELTLNPGEEKTVMLSVSNRLGEEREFAVDIEDAQGSKNVREPVVLLGEDRGPYSLKDYIQLPAYKLSLAHNTRARIPVTISIPPDAEPGGRYGSVLIHTVTVRGSDGGGEVAPQSPIVSRIGTLFFITIPGDTNKSGEVIDFSTIPKKKWYQEGPMTFGVTFENTGDIHLAPYGEIRITNMFDEEVGFVELEPWFVYPQAIRLREITWDREALLGRYTATLKVNRSYDDVIDTKEITFYVIPMKIIIGTFVVVFFVLFLFRFIAKNFEFRRKV